MSKKDKKKPEAVTEQETAAADLLSGELQVLRTLQRADAP